MKNLDTVAKELFNKIRGRYPSITVGDDTATITNRPNDARFFEFDYANGKKVSVNLDDKSLTVMYSDKLFDEQDESSKQNWFEFLKELRQFAKKRMLNFDTRNITKSNLDKRDYEYLSTEKQMSESKLYGTSRTSFQDIGSAKMIVKHTQPINHEQPAGRTRDIAGIYIESAEGERFKYPYRHLNGARAMARHVAEGGKPYDDFGKYISGLSEELNNLRKFKTYMNRSSVMAEGLAQYMDVVNERIETVKKTAHALQSSSKYKEAFDNFETTVLEEVPEDVSNTWIDELTIKQFNEELKGVFPYIYKLVSEANKVKDLGPEDLVDEGKVKGMVMDMEDDAADMSRDDFITKYGKHNVDIWDKVNDEDYVDPSDYVGPEEDFEQHMNSIVDNATYDIEEDPAFEDFKMAAANAAAKGEKEFEYPKGSGKKHPTKMDKGTAAKLLADSQTNEGGVKQAEIEVQDWFNKFNEYKGTNADDLAQGWIRAVLDTGIMSDAYEENEVEAFNKKKGYPTDQIDQSWQRGDHEDFTSNKSGVSPITAGMFSTINAIMKKYGLDEEDIDDMSKADDPSYDKPVKDSIEDQRTDEVLPALAIPAIGVIARMAIGALGKGLAKKGAKEAIKKGAIQGSKIAGNIAKNTAKTVAKNPGKAAVVGGGAYALDKLDDFKDFIVNSVEDIMKFLPEGAEAIARMAAKYALPASVAVVLAYGGYKLIQKATDDAEEKPQEDEKDVTIDISPKGSGDELKPKNEVPLEEFVKSMYDYTQNAFPKGETAVLTAVQKKYGDEAVDEAHAVIKELLAGQDEEMARIQHLAGLR